MTVKNIGKNIKIFACIGSGGAGLSFCCNHIVKPKNIGSAPISKKSGGVQFINPNKLNILVGSRSERSF